MGIKGLIELHPTTFTPKSDQYNYFIKYNSDEKKVKYQKLDTSWISTNFLEKNQNQNSSQTIQSIDT